MESAGTPYAERLRNERQRLALSQAVVSAAGCVSKSTQVAYEAGQRVPDLAYLDGIDSLGVDRVYILTGMTSAQYAAKNVRWALHRAIIEAISESAAARGGSIPPSKIADLVHILYDQFHSSEEIDRSVVAAAVRLAM